MSLFHVLDSLQGRKVVRALWDYYKVDGVIATQYELKRRVTPTGSEREGPGEASFSMLKLKEIAKQRELFSSLESFTSEADDSDSQIVEEDDDYFSDGSSYSYKTDEDIEEVERSSSYSSVWRRRRRDRRYKIKLLILFNFRK